MRGLTVSADYEEQHFPLPPLEPMIPTISLKFCEYDKENKVLKMASEFIGMPHEFFLHSHHTGKEVRFIAVGSEDKLWDPDGWDGEMCVYRPMGNVPNVDHMVIYNQY